MRNQGKLDSLELKQIRKVLVIQLGPFGDGLLTTAYFETLKRHLPGIELHYLIKEPYHHCAKRHPFIDRLVVIPSRTGLAYLAERIRTIWAIRREGYDLLIDQQNKRSSHIITLFSGVRHRLGYGHCRMSWVYNLIAARDPHRYTASRRFDMLRPLGIEEEPYRLYFPIPEPAQEKIDQWLTGEGLQARDVVVISPGSRQLRKRWRTEFYAQLADMIQSQTGKRVVILWAGAEKPDAQNMVALMDTSPVLAPPTTLEEAAALLSRCCLLICNDSGLNHLAVTTQTQTLAIFGNTQPQQWSPAGAFSHHHHLYVPGSSKKDDTFGISPEEAFAKVQSLIGSSSE